MACNEGTACYISYQLVTTVVNYLLWEPIVDFEQGKVLTD